MEMLSAPFSGMLSSMTVKYGKETLPANASVIYDEGVSIFHGSSGADIFRDADVVCPMLSGPLVWSLCVVIVSCLR